MTSPLKKPVVWRPYVVRICHATVTHALKTTRPIVRSPRNRLLGYQGYPRQRRTTNPEANARRGRASTPRSREGGEDPRDRPLGYQGYPPGGGASAATCDEPRGERPSRPCEHAEGTGRAERIRATVRSVTKGIRPAEVRARRRTTNPEANARRGRASTAKAGRCRHVAASPSVRITPRAL